VLSGSLNQPCSHPYQEKLWELWSARITKDSTEWDGLATAACTLHVIAFTAFIQSKSYTIEVPQSQSH